MNIVINISNSQRKQILRRTLLAVVWALKKDKIKNFSNEIKHFNNKNLKFRKSSKNSENLLEIIKAFKIFGTIIS